MKIKMTVLALAVLAVASLAWAGVFTRIYAPRGGDTVTYTANPSHQNFALYILDAENSTVKSNNGTWQIRARMNGQGNWTTVATNLAMNSTVFVYNIPYNQFSANASRLNTNQTWSLNVNAWGL